MFRLIFFQVGTSVPLRLWSENCWNIVLLVYILKLPWDKCQLNYTFGKYVKHYQRSKIVHHFDFEKRNHINKLHNNYLLDSFYEVLFSSD